MARPAFSTYVLAVCLLAPAACSAAEGWRFIVTGDSRGATTGVNERVLSELAGEVLRQEADLVIFSGDLVFGVSIDAAEFESQLWNWVRVMQPVYDAGIPVYVCRGNHEVGDAWYARPEGLDPIDNCALRWLKVFGSEDHPQIRLPDNGPDGEKHMSYSVVHKNALIVALDQYAGMDHDLAHSVNQAWLESQLEANVKPHVFVFGHEPAFRALHSDCLDMYPDRRDAFWGSLKAAGARMYFCGHDHFYDHARVDDGDGNPDNDIHQFIVAVAGAPFYSWTPPYSGNNSGLAIEQIWHAERYGYLCVDVQDLEVTVAWMERRDNNVLMPGLYEVRDAWKYRVLPDLVLLHPVGGERIPADRAYTIRWKTIEGAQAKRVVLEYSLDGGAHWIAIDEADNTGAYAWLTPSLGSDTCLLRIRAVDDATISGATDSTFSIVECPSRLTADLNNDCRVDFADLAILASQWLAGDSFPNAAK